MKEKKVKEENKELSNHSFIDAWKNAFNGIICNNNAEEHTKTINNCCNSSYCKFIF